MQDRSNFMLMESEQESFTLGEMLLFRKAELLKKTKNKTNFSKTEKALKLHRISQPRFKIFS